MTRYVRKVTALVPAPTPAQDTHEVWVGYDFPWLVDEDLSAVGLVRADGFSDEQLLDHGIRAFDTVDKSNGTTLRLLGIVLHP